jgi:hypothetical protein
VSLKAPRSFGERLVQCFLTFGIPVAVLHAIVEWREHSLAFLTAIGISDAIGMGFLMAVMETLFIGAMRRRKP